ARPFYQSCPELPMISILAPDRKLLANSFSDGKTLGRLNDLIADGKGGACFTVGGAYHVSANGAVTTVADPTSIRSNGIMLSPDGLTLYVTNNTSVVAFDVRPDSSPATDAISPRSMATMGAMAWPLMGPAGFTSPPTKGFMSSRPMESTLG